MRGLLILGLVAIVTGCSDAASAPAPTPSPALIQGEPIASAGAEDFEGCHYDPTPVLHVTSEQVYLDGLPVDDAELGSRLRDQKALYARLGAPEKTAVVLQVTRGVSERRVARVLAIASGAGFVEVTRLADAANR